MLLFAKGAFTLRWGASKIGGPLQRMVFGVIGTEATLERDLVLWIVSKTANSGLT